MKFMYFSLYMFYTKIISVQKHYPPRISVVGILAALQVFLITAIIDTYFFLKTNEILVRYPAYIPLILWFILYKLNEDYFQDKEELIIKELSSKSIKYKLNIYVFSFLSILIIFWLSFRHGLYQIIKILFF